MTGWVRISREVFDHPVFQPGEMSEREAWLWLIAHAAWKDTHHNIRGVVYIVPRGSLFVTLREMQLAWRWRSEKRVRGFLDRLEAASMIGRKTDAAKTQLSICNYDKYQEGGRTADAAGTQPGRIKETREQKISPSSSDARDSIAIADQCIEALGEAANPTAIGLQTSCPVAGWIAAGNADLELDVLPVMRRYATNKPRHSIRSWPPWMAQDVADHRARRLQPLPDGRATGPPIRVQRETAADFAAELQALSRGSHDPNDTGKPDPTVPRLAYSAAHG